MKRKNEAARRADQHLLTAAIARRGLTRQEAASRLREEGPNELPGGARRTFFTIVAGVVREPMFALLLGGGAIYLALGSPGEAFMLLSFVFVVIGLSVYQERKTERALDELRDLSSPRALVLRDGEQQRIAGRDLVRGDLILLAEGDRVPADGAVLSSSHLAVDESLLTGEAVPVRKTLWDQITPFARPGVSNSFVYGGTLVVGGQALVEVTLTGPRSELGRIGQALGEVAQEDTLLQQETRRVVRVVAYIGALLCLAVFVAYGLTRGDWLRALLSGITLAMALLPEEIPLVLTVFLALGAWRLARKNVLTRRVPAVEALGATTVMCVDKTGTLTANRLGVRTLYNGESSCDPRGEEPLGEPFHLLVECAVLASHRHALDPIDRALQEYGLAALAGTEHLHANWELVQEYPLSRRLLAMSRVWRSPEGTDLIIAAKGAPEAVADLCHLPSGDLAALDAVVQTLAARGERVIGVAWARLAGNNCSQVPMTALPDLPTDQHDFHFELLGLIGFEDGIRPAVPASVAEARDAGLRTVMVTGDAVATAREIARQAGLHRPLEVLTGAELDAMDDATLQHRVQDTDVFARVLPEHKLRLVRAHQANGDVVAMTGDGVNDAPALKAADIGIAMGTRGTDVAREAASLVLLDDDFSSIVTAIRMGRRIFDNLRKAITYIIAVHVPIAGLSLLPVLMGWPLLLLPVHIVFLELIIDPACSIVFEASPEEGDVMSRPPRLRGMPLIDRATITLGVVQGAVVLSVCLGVFAWGLTGGHDEAEARTLAFTTLLFSNIALIVTNLRRSSGAARASNKSGYAVGAGAVAFLLLTIYLPGLRETCHFSILQAHDWYVALGASALTCLLLRPLKRETSGTCCRVHAMGSILKP